MYRGIAMSIEEIGCCGAYCKTCMQWQKDRYPNERTCLGCKLGYGSGGRDISKAKCKMKVCCIGKGYNSCADCAEYSSCDTIQGLYAKNGYKYRKYREATEFIRANGYDKFLAIADTWNRAHGKYK
jgi:hypothetical protein